MNAMFPNAPWALSLSYARALQEPVMRIWAGRAENVANTQPAYYQRGTMNSLARQGKWRPELEHATTPGQ